MIQISTLNIAAIILFVCICLKKQKNTICIHTFLLGTVQGQNITSKQNKQAAKKIYQN